MTRTIKQEKRFNIISQPELISGHGYCYEIEGIAWFENEVWVSDEHCEKLLEQVIKKWEKIGTWSRPRFPELEVYWATIEEKVE
jgi:hypothetical protein